MKLQILIPQYKETDEIVKPLLDSIAIQQNVDMGEIGVVICNDGTDVLLSDDLLSSYPYKIEYYKYPHRGVSATRNACLDCATADYVMFCDADDMLYNACGLYIIFREMKEGFDSFVSAFIEETRDPFSKEPVYVTHDVDSTFVHGKVHRREYLLKEHIRWNDALTVHEDSYFNCLCQKLSRNVKYCPTPFYLWKWRDNSVCRHDPKYIFRTYNNMLDSSDALVREFERRGRTAEAQFYAVGMIYDSYFTMNKAEWMHQENQNYRSSTERRFHDYYQHHKHFLKEIPTEVKAQIIVSIKNRFFAEGLFMESITFDEWTRHVEADYR